MSGINKAIVVGRLGQPVEMKYTPSGQAVANFSVATTENWMKDGEKQERTEWHRLVVWGKQAESCAQYLIKGSQVYIEAKIQTRSWEKDGVKKYTTELVVSGPGTTVQFLSSKNPEKTENGETKQMGDQFVADEIPF